jgi:hypothetical protein
VSEFWSTIVPSQQLGAPSAGSGATPASRRDGQSDPDHGGVVLDRHDDAPEAPVGEQAMVRVEDLGLVATDEQFVGGTRITRVRAPTHIGSASRSQARSPVPRAADDRVDA